MLRPEIDAPTDRGSGGEFLARFHELRNEIRLLLHLTLYDACGNEAFHVTCVCAGQRLKRNTA